MAESSYDKIAEIADYLKLSISAEEIAGCFTKLNMNQEEIDKTVEFFEILEENWKNLNETFDKLYNREFVYDNFHI